MDDNLLKFFGKLRKSDKNHPDEGFQITADGEKVRIERRQQERRKLKDKRLSKRQYAIDRRIKGLERRLGIDWRAWIK